MQSVPNLKFHAIKHYLFHLFSATRRGHGVHSPFVYRLCENVFYNSAQFYDFQRFDKLRKDLQRNSTVLEINDLGAGSLSLKGPARKVKEIAKHGISSAKQNRILFHLINFFNCSTCIELGTSLGLNTLYMAASNKKARIYSLEGAHSLLNFARDLALEQGINNIEFIEGHFDQSLPKLLDRLSQFDLAYVDGNHTYSSTLNYFELLLGKKHSGSVILFDDIYWSPEMTRAWKEITEHKEVRLSIDCYYMGLVFFREEILEKQNIRLWI